MYRVTPIICRSRNVLYQRNTIDTRVATFSLTPTACKSYASRERVKCPPPPPLPPPPPPGWKLKFTLLVLTAITGYLTVAAKKSPEMRDWMSIHAPWFDDFIAIVYQENMTHKELIQKCIDDFKEMRERPKSCSTDGLPAGCNQDSEPPRERIECPEEPKATNKEGKECEILPPPIITTDICELEGCLKERGDSAYYGYMTARDACKVYNELVVSVMSDFCIHTFESLGPAAEERHELVTEHAGDADEAWANLSALEKYLDCGGMKASKEQIENTKLLFNEYQAKIKNMQAEYLWEEDRANAAQSKIGMVKDLIDTYMEENQGMFPSVDYKSKKPQFTDDADFFLIHSYKYMKKLRLILEELAEAMTSRATRAVEALPEPADDKAKKERDQVIPTLLKAKQTDLENSYKQRLDSLKAYTEGVHKRALKQQADRQQEVLATKLQELEGDATARLKIMVDTKVAAEKKLFDAELAEMGAKLKEVEDKLEGRLKAEKERKRSQDLYAAASSLLAATKKGGSKVKIDDELAALEKAADGEDTLVFTVLKSIPEEVRKHGLVPEAVLRDRYYGMEGVALRVALVEQEGAPLPVYIMSYIQSMLLFMKLNGIPQEDVDKPIRDNMQELDTFDILQRARYWIQQGNMAAALRYVGSLEGASRAAAARWHADASTLIAIRQAAEAVIAHATALGLKYV